MANKSDQRQVNQWDETLLHQLLAQVDENGPVPKLTVNSNIRSKEVLLDVEVEGARYILTRLCSEQAPVAVNLSPREQEIVRLVAKGLPNKTIATVLEISPWTVGTHLRRIFSKLNVNSRAEMVARAMEVHLII